MLKQALREPMRQLATNSGEDGGVSHEMLAHQATGVMMRPLVVTSIPSKPGLSTRRKWFGWHLRMLPRQLPFAPQ
jgi:chaperonin GroEL (HSP60 family)